MDQREAFINVAGHQHHLEAAMKVAVGQKVTLHKEPENKFDNNAIRVENEDSEHIGYIPRNRTQVFHPMMDSGAFISAEVVRLQEPIAEHYVAIFMKMVYDFDVMQAFVNRKLIVEDVISDFNADTPFGETEQIHTWPSGGDA